MRTVVTGVAGFIGSHIAESLIRQGYDVIGIDDLSAGYFNNIPKGVFFIQDDICNIKRYSSLLQDVDVVFHNAASKKNICMKDPARDMMVNGIGTLLLLQECVIMKVPKFIYASTGSVYGEVSGTITEETPRNPCSYYGVSKMAGETYVRLFGTQLNITVLRYFHVYGDRQESAQDTGGVVAIFKDKIQKGEKVFIHGDGSQRRVFTYVEDIVSANIESWRNSIASGKVYNCASNVSLSIIELLDILMKKYNCTTEICYADPLIGDIYNFNVNSSKIQEIGVEFRPITEVL